MSLLTDQEITRICNGWPGNAEKAARAIERAVIAKLATVSAEPVACYAGHRLTPDGTTEFYGYADKKLEPSTMLYPAEALAAARVQAINDALNCYSPDDTATDWSDKIRALAGGSK